MQNEEVSLKVDKRSASEVVRKAWHLYCQWQKTGFGPDKKKYEEQRVLAERAIALLPKNQREEFILP